MQQNFFKYFSITVLLTVFLFPQNYFAQQLSVVKSDAERVIKQYEQGYLTNPTFDEKQIISEYLESIQKPNNISKEGAMSPNATILLEEDFTQQLLVDDFDFTGLLTDNGWSVTSGGGTQAIETTTGLTYTDYPGSGIGNAAGLDNTGEDDNRQFTAVTSGYVFYSALVNVTTAAQGYFLHLGNSNSSFHSRVFVQPSLTPDKINFGMSNSSTIGTVAWGTTDFDDSTTYLIIVKSQVANPGTNDVWILSSGVPTDEAAAGTPEISTNVGTGLASITGIYLRQFSATQNITVDGIRVGTSWGALFPDGTTPPTGWTNVDNGSSGQIWEFNNPYPRTITGNFDADFAILDSDNYGNGGSQNATLTTIAVDCGTATTVSFGFDNQFRSYSGSSGTVEVSNDGTNWTLLETITTSTGYPNPPVYKEYDVTSVAAGQSTVYFRWTYVGSWGYWWAIDNVVVYEPDAFPLPAIVVNPLDADIDVLPSTTLDWVAGGGSAPTGYKINFGTDNPPTNIENGTDLGLVTQYTPASALTYGTTYYWEIIPYNGSGDATGTSVWSFTVLTPITQPYNEDFNDTTAAGWLTTGFNLFTNHGTSGSVAVSKNFWSVATTGWVQTPLVGPLTATSQLEFSYRIVNYTGYPGTATVLGADSFKIQISTDLGTTFTDEYVITSSNHVTSTSYATVNVPLGSYSGQDVIVRWDGKWATGDYYFDIDDIAIDELAILAPTNLTAVADTFAVLLNWTDNSSNELGFYIERKNGDTLSIDPYVVIDTVGADVVAYNDLGRTPNTTYSYRVQAYNLSDVSTYSNEVTTTTIIPVELTSFVANVNDREISVVWSTATELNNKGFELERKLDAQWQKVTFIEGRGTSTEKSDYYYSDKFEYDGFQGTVQYRLKQIDFDGTITYSNVISVEVDFTPKEYALYQNYPNPFNPSTIIKFALPFDSNVRIAVYNLLGEQIKVILEQVKEVGYHNVSWNASDLATGVYIYTIDAKSIDGLKNFNSVKKMMLIK